MAGLLHRGQAFLTRKQATAAGVTVLYRRGTDEVSLTAWPGNTPVAVEEAGRSATSTRQARLQRGQRDYLIPLAELQRVGFDEPAAGDRITETLNGSAVTFEIRPTPGQPPWAWSDTDRTRYRVTTKQV